MKYIERFEEIAKEACHKQGVALYDIETIHAAKGLVIVLYITKIGGVTVGECRSVSRTISMVMEEDEFIDERYYLEVSSPGLERNLKLKKHYVSAIGEKIQITFLDENEDSVTKVGELTEVLQEHVVVAFLEEELPILFKNIKKAKTYFDYKKDK
ncbi:MAG: ribosome assembly cofactor RimP [Candidatus Cloacimonetes bacterium]|nr:ribosome assembly cofactor RimP [Candidatus Cloacimonadota bacterium]